MKQLEHVGKKLALYLRLFPDKIGASDLDRKMTFCFGTVAPVALPMRSPALVLAKGGQVCVALPADAER